MAKRHKYHSAGLKLSSALAPAQLLAIAKQAAGTLKPLVLDAETLSSLRFLVKNWARVTFMSFGVDAASEGARTTLTTTISEYQTSQATVFFIPIGPKEMLGTASTATTCGRSPMLLSPRIRVPPSPSPRRRLHERPQRGNQQE